MKTPKKAPYELHPLAELYPAMGPDEYKPLHYSIRDDGQRDPVITYDGKLIDGRHRAEVCVELGLKIKWKEWDGKGSMVQFVIDKNSNRRQLTTSQRSMVA